MQQWLYYYYVQDNEHYEEQLFVSMDTELVETVSAHFKQQVMQNTILFIKITLSMQTTSFIYEKNILFNAIYLDYLNMSWQETDCIWLLNHNNCRGFRPRNPAFLKKLPILVHKHSDLVLVSENRSPANGKSKFMPGQKRLKDNLYT